MFTFCFGPPRSRRTPPRPRRCRRRPRPWAPASTRDVEEAGPGDLDPGDAVGRLSRAATRSAKSRGRLPGLLGQLERDVGGVVAVPLLPRALDRHRLGHAAGQRDRALGGRGPPGRRRSGRRAARGSPGKGIGGRRRPRPTSACRIAHRRRRAVAPVSAAARAAGMVVPHLSPRSSGDRAPPSGGGSEGSNPSGGAAHEHRRSDQVNVARVSVNPLARPRPVAADLGTRPSGSSPTACCENIRVWSHDHGECGSSDWP